MAKRHGRADEPRLQVGATSSVPENMFGHGIACLIQDAIAVSEVGRPKLVRGSRLAVSIVLVAFVISLQIFIVTQAKHLVCAPAVHHIRELYDQYEEHMYEEGKTYRNRNNKTRGMEGFLRPENFETFHEGKQNEVCQIPLSQPTYMFLVLFVWTTSCMLEMRRCLICGYRILVLTPTTPLLKDCTQVEKDKSITVIGLPRWLKALVTVLALLPQFGTAIYLLWLGCRFLIATPGFVNSLLNSLALEFILLLKELLYKVLLAQRNTNDTQRVHLLEEWRDFVSDGELAEDQAKGARHRASTKEQTELADRATVDLSMPYVIVVLATVWVMLYIYYFQRVLPDYRWDVRKVCNTFLRKTSSGFV